MFARSVIRIALGVENLLLFSFRIFEGSRVYVFFGEHKFDWFKESSVLLKSGEIIFFSLYILVYFISF